MSPLARTRTTHTLTALAGAVLAFLSSQVQRSEEFGALRAQVTSIQSQIAAIQADVRDVRALAIHERVPSP